jgi:SAM-dependent methyltransferase
MQPTMFAEGASYERFMGRWSRQLAPQLVAFAGVRDGETVLDVGSGTGSLAFAIADAVPSAHVVGVDPAQAYVADANERVSSPRIRFTVGDVQQLQFAGATFDRVIALLSLNFGPDAATALREMVRVTRRGGVVAGAVWDYGAGMQMLRIFWDEAVRRDPAIANRDERNMPLCRAGDLAALWRKGGLKDVEERPLDTCLLFESFEDYWSPFAGGQGPVGWYVAKLSIAHRAALRRRLRERLLNGGPDRAILLDARAWAVKGIVPERRVTR